MAERMSTARRMDRARKNGRITRAANSKLKIKERASRDARMAEIIKKSEFPYIPSVMSWLSTKLNKPCSLITPEDVQKAIA